MSKQVKDRYGTLAVVKSFSRIFSESATVVVSIVDGGDTLADLDLSPKQAKRLAKVLRRAAKKASR